MPGLENLTFEEFEMGFQATVVATAQAPTFAPEDAPWRYRDGARLLREMSDTHPDFHTALTDVNPFSEEARHADVLAQIELAKMGRCLPERPESAEIERLLGRGSLRSPYVWYTWKDDQR